MVLPYTAQQAQRWQERGPEPFELSPSGWERSELDVQLPNERAFQLQRAGATVTVTRWWDRPLRPGGPMASERSRQVMVGGSPRELIATSMFEGQPSSAQVVFLRAPGWMARLVFDGCTPQECDEICAALTLRDADRRR